MTLDMGRKEKCIGVVKVIILHIADYLLLCTHYNEMAEKLIVSKYTTKSTWLM